MYARERGSNEQGANPPTYLPTYLDALGDPQRPLVLLPPPSSTAVVDETAPSAGLLPKEGEERLLRLPPPPVRWTDR